MSIGYTIDDGIAFVRWDGLVTAAEWLRHIGELVVDPMWPPPRARQLSDLRFARLDASIDEPVFSEAAALLGRNSRIDRLKAAIVAGAAYPQARMFEDVIARHGATVFAFNSLNPACDWLGINVDHADRTLASLRPSASSAR